MSIVYQHDKRSGITYAYESTSYWDKEKKQSRSKRKLIGRVDKESGAIYPTDKRMIKARLKRDEPDWAFLFALACERCLELEQEIAKLKKTNTK